MVSLLFGEAWFQTSGLSDGQVALLIAFRLSCYTSAVINVFRYEVYVKKATNFHSVELAKPRDLLLLGTRFPQQCPPGTLRNARFGEKESDCSPCDPGQFCAGTNNTASTGPCSAGYYCPQDAKISSDRPNGFECPPGFFCEANSAQPSPCNASKSAFIEVVADLFSVIGFY